MTKTRVGSLCAGYGGIEIGLRLAGVEVDLRWLAENEPSLDPVHPAGVLNLRDVIAADWTSVEPVDMLTAGFPCQPVSAAGRQLGEADPRWLWPAVRASIRELRPQHVLIENVRNLLSADKGQLWAGILVDLVALGYGARWLTLGACHVGAAHHRHRVFALATMDARGVERIATTFCGAKGGMVLPTPARSDAKRGWSTRAGGDRHDEVGSLAGIGQLLPTPTARDGDGRGEGDARYWSARAEHRANGLPLGAEVTLLPTPRATDGANGGPGQRGRRGDLAMPSAVQHWGRFAEAVARHEALYGPAPAPAEPNRNGAPRLAPAFAEWLMCLPAGHVTGKLARVPALKAIGNGVCPPQLAAAYRLLMGAS